MPDEVFCFNDGGVTSVIGLTSRVAFNLTVQVVHIVRPMVWTVVKTTHQDIEMVTAHALNCAYTHILTCAG